MGDSVIQLCSRLHNGTYNAYFTTDAWNALTELSVLASEALRRRDEDKAAQQAASPPAANGTPADDERDNRLGDRLSWHSCARQHFDHVAAALDEDAPDFVWKSLRALARWASKGMEANDTIEVEREEEEEDAGPPNDAPADRRKTVADLLDWLGMPDLAKIVRAEYEKASAAQQGEKAAYVPETSWISLKDGKVTVAGRFGSFVVSITPDNPGLASQMPLFSEAAHKLCQDIAYRLAAVPKENELEGTRFARACEMLRSNI